MSLTMNEMMPPIMYPGGRAVAGRRCTFHGVPSHDMTTRQDGQRKVHTSVTAITEHAREKSREDNFSWEEGVDDYNLSWLFDPNRNDHLPLEQQLKMYSRRDLRKSKLFNIGTRLWPNEEHSRRRVINVSGGFYPRSAPTIVDSRTEVQTKGAVEATQAPPPVQTTGKLRPHKPRTIEPDPKEVREKSEKAKLQEHMIWVDERRKFRQQLDNLGLSEEYLRRKPDKTLMESRVLREMVAVRTAQPPSLPPEEEPPLVGILPSESPIIRRPSPVAIRLIEKFLRQKKMRLVDLFAVVDKDKNWLITREDFRKAIQQAKIPISEVLLEDLVLTLDTDLDDVLDYRDLAQGMGLWKAEKWETKRKRIAHAATADDQGKQFLLSGLEKPDTQEYQTQEGNIPTVMGRPDVHWAPEPNKGRTSRVKSALSALSSRSSPFLEPPEPDLRPEQMILSSEEAMVDLRKRDREALPRNLDARKKQMKHRRQVAAQSGKPQPPQRQPSSTKPDVCAIIKTGDTAIDNHFQRSTLGGNACVVLNKFRQAVFNEYVELCRMCERAEIPLTEEILKRALLYPPDKPHNNIKKRIRQPDSLISRDSFATSTTSRKHSSVSGPGGSTGKKRYSHHAKSVAFSGPGHGARRSKGMSDGYDASSRVVSRRVTSCLYPPADYIMKAPEKMYLSTGKAHVSSKVQCWMTFEEYEEMIGKLVNGYTPLPGRSKEGTFWPGYMLDKLRLHMPDEKRDTEGAMFHRTTRGGRRHNYGYDNDLKMWPFEAGGCIQYGTIKPYYG